MKAIENIKNQISAKFAFTINANNELPEVNWIYEKANIFREEANESVKRMKDSGLFTKEECQEVADFAAMTIREAAHSTILYIKQVKREQFVF